MATLGYPSFNSEMPRSRVPARDERTAHCARCGCTVESRSVMACEDCKDALGIIRGASKKFPPIARCA